MNSVEDIRKQTLRRWSSLKTERESWISHWQDISRYLLPRTGRFLVSDRNKGDKRHNNILDNTGTRALRVLSAGLMAGMTSPARPWFRLTTSIPELDEAYAVKEWLSQVTRLMLMIFSRSNTYRALHSMYEELGAFGTSSSIVLSDYQDVIRFYSLTAGEYAIATDFRGCVDTLYREFDMTVGQMIQEFGKDKCSVNVQQLYDKGSVDKWRTVVHAIEPRRERKPGKRDNKNLPWKSVYLEFGARENDVLRESGFQSFCGLCPRWAVYGGDIYGNSPAMEALGDIKQLQQEQLRKGQGIDYKTNPPLQMPTSAKHDECNTLPGGVSYVDSSNPNGGIRSAFEVNLDLNYLLQDIQDVRERIKSSFYADLFLILANSDNPQMTATEVAERHEEKLLMLGPVLERMHNEILDPLIELTFERIVEAGILPPPPQEMQGRELSVEFVSMLAQAQRAIATNSIDRYVTKLGMVAQIKPGVLDKFDADNWADEYADMLGIDPDLIVPGEQVALIREQRAKQHQAQQQMEMASQIADAAGKLGSVDTSQKNALTDATRAFAGYT